MAEEEIRRLQEDIKNLSLMLVSTTILAHGPCADIFEQQET
jgi:hypothetical protein